MSKTLLITGGTGLVGRHLAKAALNRGYSVVVLTRRLPFGKWKTSPEHKQLSYCGWTYLRMPEQAVLKADAAVHLAGANIFTRRWTSRRKKLILESRVQPSLALASILRKQGKKLSAYVSASAVGYYGTLTSEEVFGESQPPGRDFTGQTGFQWERAADEVAALGVRTVKLRTGIVLASDGGALAKMLPIFRLGLGAPLGTGRQYFPWIHVEDLVNMYLMALESEELEGAYNAAVQSDTTSKSFSASLAKVLGKPYFMPTIPGFVLRSILGERSKLLLEGSRVSDEKIRAAGFVFRWRELELALADLLKR